jgi:hypothetical protein
MIGNSSGFAECYQALNTTIWQHAYVWVLHSENSDDIMPEYDGDSMRGRWDM